MKLSKILTALCLSIVSGLSIADECTSWGCISTISELYITGGGTIRVGTPLDEKLANCTPVSDVYFTLDPAKANAKEMYSALLSAYMSNKKIQLRISEGSADCTIAYIRLKTTF